VARLVTWSIVSLAVLNVAFLAALPALAGGVAGRLDIPRPPGLSEPPEEPAAREEPAVPVEELHEALRLPRVDTSPTDEHSRASLAAYEAGDYETAFTEAVLALDPAPLEENKLLRALMIGGMEDIHTTVKKPNGREAAKTIDEALQSVQEDEDAHTAARLNNAAAMFILYLYGLDPTMFPEDPGMVAAAGELAYQAADLRPDYCPALLNLTLFGGVANFPVYDLMPIGGSLVSSSATPTSWTGYYPIDGCADPALLYYLAQASIIPLGDDRYDVTPALDMADRLQEEHPRWAGLAHSVRGDAYYWYGVYAVERNDSPRPFTAKRYFELALHEYDAALALQPDDPAIRHGKALAYLELGEVDRAIREARTALEAAPDSLWLRTTLAEAYAAKKDHATAARLYRSFLSEPRPEPEPPMLVPYSAISHGADLYTSLWVAPFSQGAGTVTLDDEVIQPFEERLYTSSGINHYAPAGINQFRDERWHYVLLRNDLLSGDSAAFNRDLESVPRRVRQNALTLLLVGVDRLLNQPEGSVTPVPETQAAIDEFLATGFFHNASLGEPEPRANDTFYREAGNFFRQYGQYEKARRIYDIWRVELVQAEAGADRLAEVEKLLGEAHFLNDEPQEALTAFERAMDLRPDWPPYAVRWAFMYEQLEEYDAAAESYRSALDAMRRPAEWFSGILGAA
jgi:tetratricopeptide (TPR) repeat protein